MTGGQSHGLAGQVDVLHGVVDEGDPGAVEQGIVTGPYLGLGQFAAEQFVEQRFENKAIPLVNQLNR